MIAILIALAIGAIIAGVAHVAIRRHIARTAPEPMPAVQKFVRPMA